MSQLTAETLVEDDNIRMAMEKFHAEHEEYAVETGVEHQWEYNTYYGSLSAMLEGRTVSIRVSAEDETCLSYMKMAVAGHIAEFLGTTRGLRWNGDGAETGTPVFFREIMVQSSTRISPHMQRIRFTGDNLARFASGGLHVRLLLPPKDRKPVWPTVGSDGLIVWPSGDDALTVRVYTIRAIDPVAGWFDVDFVLHEGDHMPAATFAANAKAGEVIGLFGPGGGDASGQRNLLLFGDDTALPAIGRTLDNLAPGSRADVFIEVDSPADSLPLAEGDNINVTWLYRHGREPGTANLLSQALQSLDQASLADDVFIWAGCEFGDFRELRRIARKEWGLKKDRQLIVAYWRRGISGEEGVRSEE